MTPEIIDYGQFAERLRRHQQGWPRWELLEAVQREWGYEDPGGEPGHSRWGGENQKHGIDWELPVPLALNEWWDSPLNSFAFKPRLYWVHTQWPPKISELEVAHESGLLTGEGVDRRVCVFMSEYHYIHEWGYLTAEAEEPDPPRRRQRRRRVGRAEPVVVRVLDAAGLRADARALRLDAAGPPGRRRRRPADHRPAPVLVP